MNLRAIAIFLWACLIASAAVAGEKHETHIRVVTEAGDFEWSGSDADGDLSDLEIGESKTLAGKDGKEVTVTRIETGLSFDIGGETIEIMEFGGEHAAHDDGHVVINKMKNVKVIKPGDAADVTIISAAELDGEARARIEEVLRDAGNDGDILFVDGSELSGEEQAHSGHEVRIIRQKIETTN